MRALFSSTAALEDFMLSLVDDALRDLGAAQGSDGLRAAPVLSLVPAILDGPRPDGADLVRLRYDTAPVPPGDDLPAWGDPDAPLVDASFGSVTQPAGWSPPC